MKLKKRASFRLTMHILLAGTAAILFWRGAWGLMDLYIFPDHELASYLASLVLGLVILLSTNMLKDELA